MLEILGFFAAVVIISASGVMAPGPLFASTVSSAIRWGTSAGLKIAAGHTLVELPLVLAIGLGALSLESFSEYRGIVAILGASSIFAFAGLQIRTVLKPHTAPKESRYGAFATGVLLTGLNPFFLAWWFTIGIKLISDALVLWAIWGILVMFGMHIWMDYVWLFFVSALSSRGASLLSGKKYRICMILVNLTLVYFGVSFVVDAF
jgi:threonine/homoserine/homoserine lactone efflux protein